MLTQQMNELIEAIYRDPPPLMMLVDPKSARMWEAATKFQGCNHRRIKREMNKAWRKERQAEIKRHRQVGQLVVAESRFDKVAYQREYMKGWRARKKAEK